MSESGPADTGIARLQAQLRALSRPDGQGDWGELAPQFADLQQGLAALSGEVAGAQAVLEARLATLEDALAGVADRFETLARDAAGRTGESLAATRAGLQEIRAELGVARTTALDGAALGSGALDGAVNSAVSGPAGALGRALEDSVDDLAAALETSLDALPEVLAEPVAWWVAEQLEPEFGRLQAQLDTLAGSAVRTGDMLSLRSDLADALEEVRDRVVEATAQRLDALREELRAQLLLELRSEWTAQVAALDHAVETRLEPLLDRVQDGVDGLDASRQLLERVDQRLTGAGRALLDYLVERDLALEAERDRVLHELLDDLAAGLPAGERRALSGRASALVERRRAERDAARWRALQNASRPTAEVDENELVRRFTVGPHRDRDEGLGPNSGPDGGTVAPAQSGSKRPSRAREVGAAPVSDRPGKRGPAVDDGGEADRGPAVDGGAAAGAPVRRRTGGRKPAP